MLVLTKEEKAWIKKLQKVLNECPSDRIGGYTIGDPCITLYDVNYEYDIDVIMDSGKSDFCLAVGELDCSLGDIKLPFTLYSVAG